MANQSRKAPPTAPLIPREIDELLGPPPSIPNVDPDDFRRMREALARAAGVVDAIDMLLIDQACRDAMEIRALRSAVDWIRANEINQYDYADRTNRFVNNVIAAADAALKLGKRTDLAQIKMLRDRARNFHLSEGRPFYDIGVKDAIDDLAALLKVERPQQQEIDESVWAAGVRSAEHSLATLQQQIERASSRFHRTLAEIDKRHLNALKMKVLLTSLDGDDVDRAVVAPPLLTSEPVE